MVPRDGLVTLVVVDRPTSLALVPLPVTPVVATTAVVVVKAQVREVRPPAPVLPGGLVKAT